MGRARTLALTALLAKAVKAVPRITSSARYSTVAHVDVRAALAGLDVPALYLQASDDLVVPPTAAEIFEKTAIRARVVVIEAPHFLLQCAPVAAAKEIEKFVREVSDSV
jgi:pimeloyl-ACP methyl ester carboxylesterase